MKPISMMLMCVTLICVTGCGTFNPERAIRRGRAQLLAEQTHAVLSDFAPFQLAVAQVATEMAEDVVGKALEESATAQMLAKREQRTRLWGVAREVGGGLYGLVMTVLFGTTHRKRKIAERSAPLV